MSQIRARLISRAAVFKLPHFSSHSRFDRAQEMLEVLLR